MAQVSRILNSLFLWGGCARALQTVVCKRWKRSKGTATESLLLRYSWAEIARRALQYWSLYGFLRTCVKIIAEVHATTDLLCPPSQDQLRPTDNHFVAIIGCGKYAFSTVAFFITRNKGRCIRTCFDICETRSKSLAAFYKIPRVAKNIDEVLADPKVRVVYIVSNHASHAEYAIACLKAGKDVYIEKPPVVSQDQLQRLISAIEESRVRVYIGFNRPYSKMGSKLIQDLRSRQGTAVVTVAVAGHKLNADHWYLDTREGGRVCGNLCHWIDFALKLLPHRYPIQIVPVRAGGSSTTMVVVFVFADGSVANITFSEQGEPYGGVRERFSIHTDTAWTTLDDFQSLSTEGPKYRLQVRQKKRDLGHEASITRPLNPAGTAESTKREILGELHATSTAYLMTKQALETNCPVVLNENGWGTFGASDAQASGLGLKTHEELDRAGVMPPSGIMVPAEERTVSRK